MANDNVTQALANISYAYKVKKAVAGTSPTLLQHMEQITLRTPVEYQLKRAHDKATHNLVKEIDEANNILNEILKPIRQ